MVGTTIASIMASALMRIVRWAAPTGPCGSRTPEWQLASANASTTATSDLLAPTRCSGAVRPCRVTVEPWNAASLSKSVSKNNVRLSGSRAPHHD